MLCPENTTSKFMRSMMSSSQKFLQSKQAAEQNSNIEQETLTEKAKEDAMKPLSYQDSSEANSLLELPRYLLIMATLAASVTYEAGLSPPGRIWSANDGSHLAGDPVLRDTDHHRYKVFFYCNAASLLFTDMVAVCCLLLHSVRRCRHRRLHTHRDAMLLDKFGTMWGYEALVASILLTVVDHQMWLCKRVVSWVHNIQGTLRKCLKLHTTESQDHRDSALSDPQEIDADQHLQKSRSYLLLLAILAVSIPYQAGLTPPGGLLWETDATDGQYLHRDGSDPIHNIAYPRGYLAFFYCNTAAFAASLLVVILLLSNKFKTKGIKYCLLQAAMILDLISLIGAYATGSCRKKSAAPAEDGGDDRNRAMKRSPREDIWHVASAAAHHMTGNRSLLLAGGYSPAAHDGDEYMFVHPATGEVRQLRVHGSGSVRTESIALDDVWYVPGLDANLVSTGQLARQGCAITLGPGGCRITRGEALLGSARFTEDNKFVLDSLKVAS